MSKTYWKIHEILPPTTLRLLQANPENEVNRTLVLQRTKVPIPEEHKTYEAIKNWIETTMVRSDGTVPTANPGIAVDVTCTDREFGRCTYSAQRRAVTLGKLSDAELLEIYNGMDDCPVEYFLEEVCSAIRDDVNEDRPYMGWLTEIPASDNFSLDNFDEGDDSPEDFFVNINLPMLKTMVMDWIALHPELEFEQ